VISSISLDFEPVISIFQPLLNGDEKSADSKQVNGTSVWGK